MQKLAQAFPDQIVDIILQNYPDGLWCGWFRTPEVAWDATHATPDEVVADLARQVADWKAKREGGAG